MTKFELGQQVVITNGPWKGEVGVVIGEGWSEGTVKVKVEDQSNPYMINEDLLRLR